MKRIMCLALSLILLAIMPLSVAATEVPPVVLSNATVERVKGEVLSGAITNHEDVLTVALAQYSPTHTNNSRNAYSQNDSEESLTITQVVETTTNSDNSQTSLCAISALLVMDKDGNPVPASTINSRYMQSSGSISEYNIYAVHTMYVYCDEEYTGFDDEIRIKLSHMATRIVYGTSLTVSTTLEQGYIPNMYLENNTPQWSSKISNPSNNTNYTFYPANTTWIEIGTFHEFMTRAIIICNGTTTLTLTCLVDADNPPSFTGTW